MVIYKNKKKLCIVSSVGSSIDAFMLSHIYTLKKSFSIAVVVGDSYGAHSNIGVKRIRITRKINILSDLMALYELIKYIKFEKFDIVLSLMPKSGLLSMMAACFSGVGVRVHFFTGQVWANKMFISKYLLKSIDKLLIKCSTDILVDSKSQIDFLRKENVLLQQEGQVLGDGSISGVNLDKFKSNLCVRKKMRSALGILDNEIVFMYLGRVNKDKGILELQRTFCKLFDKHDHIKLVIVGQLEDIKFKNKISELLNNDNVIHKFGFCKNPEIIMNSADVMVLPSHREGFGTIVIEAASMNIPTIGSNIYGLQDSIVDSVTGLLHKVADVDDMFLKYSHIINNRGKIQILGNNARQRVVSNFSDKEISLLLSDFLTNKFVSYSLYTEDKK